MASRHEPLAPGEIRVLCLLPGEFGSPLSARLEILQLNDPHAAEYDAISYAWEDRMFPESLELDDGDTLPITSSLHGALQHFRYRTLCADAICIRQDDEPEKGAQVQRMWDVFAKACHVLVWLGTSTELDTFHFWALHVWASTFKPRYQATMNVEEIYIATNEIW